MYGIGVLKGMMVTFKRMVKPVATIEFPEVTRPDVAARPHEPPLVRRALHRLQHLRPGLPRRLHPRRDRRRNPDGTLEKVRYEIDFRICMYCGLCVEACPYQAIQAGGVFEDAVYEFDTMYKDKHALTKLAHEHLRRNDYTYPHGQRAPAGRHRADRGRGAASPEPRLQGRARRGGEHAWLSSP